MTLQTSVLRRRIPTWALWIGMVCGVIGLLLPPAMVADMLTGKGTTPSADVVLGARVFKVLLVLHAVLIPGLVAAANWSAGQKPDDWRGSDRSRDATGWVVLTGIVVVALIARLVGLDQGLWYDEITTLTQHVRLPMGQLLTTMDSQNQHPLYSILARLSVDVFGEANWSLRLPSVLLGVASLPALYVFGRLVTSRRESVLAAALLAVSYHHVWFSQNARGYTGLLLAALVMSAIFLRLQRGPAPGGWVVAYGAAAALGVYTNATAAFVVLAHALIWGGTLVWAPWRPAGAPRNWLPLAGVVLAGTLTMQLYALILPQFIEATLRPTMEGVAVSWKDPLWFVRETARGLAAGIPGGWLGLLVGGAVTAVGLASYARRDPEVAGVMVLPGLLLGGTLLLLEHNLWPRFFFFSFGFAALIVARGVFGTANRVAGSHATRLATLAMVVLITVSATTVPRAWHPKQDYVGAKAFVQEHRAGGDAVAVVDLATYAYAAYLQTDWSTVASVDDLRALEAAHQVVWVVFTFPARIEALHPDLWRVLAAEYREVTEYRGTVGGGDIMVLRKG